MEFNFCLTPVEEIEPWGVADGKPNLSWFALTFGLFWIVVGEQELFRYSCSIREHWQQSHPNATWTTLHYDDYQIERSWGTLLNMLPLVLDPIPEDISALIADADRWNKWESLAEAWSDSNDASVENIDDVYYCAVSWWWHRKWDAGYLVNPPQFWLWRVADDIYVRWDNREIKADGIPVWDATQGETTVSVSKFLAAVESFHTRFVSEMAERVNAIVRSEGIPGVAIDLDSLVNTQASQLGEFAHAANPWAAQVRRGFTWDEIRDAIRTIGV